MITVPITRFDGGMADDYTRGSEGQFSVSKHFDILSYPRRLQPLRGMTTESTTDSKIGNIIVADNRLYGVGTDPNNPNNGKLWVRSDSATTSSGFSYGAGSTWRSLTNDQLSGAVIRSTDYQFLVHYPDAEGNDTSNTRTIFWASTNLLIASSTIGSVSTSTQSLNFATISQGFVHPKDKRLYFGYQTTATEGSQTYIGRISPNSTPFGSVNFTALELPRQYRVYSICDYGNYLAIACTTPGGTINNSSVVILWDRDETLATISEIIPWGSGDFKVLNNLYGSLIGISTNSSASSGSGTTQDSDSVIIKQWAGGTEPVVLKEITATRSTSTAPSCSINENVNFIHKYRMYFSVNIVNGGSVPAYYGLWSIGKNDAGGYSVTVERIATNDNSDTGVLAAAISGDFVSMAHSTVGNLTYTTNGSGYSYGATSVYESTINPEMQEDHIFRKKQLKYVWCSYPPLPTNASVVMQYRVDGSPTTTWTTIFTETGDGVVRTERTKAGSTEFTSGVKYEFRITSTDGAIITDWGYKYEVLEK